LPVGRKPRARVELGVVRHQRVVDEREQVHIRTRQQEWRPGRDDVGGLADAQRATTAGPGGARDARRRCHAGNAAAKAGTGGEPDRGGTEDERAPEQGPSCERARSARPEG
jgi:hypothetical protein